MDNISDIIKSFTETLKMEFDDKMWLKEMISHHEMAIKMSNKAIKNSKDNFVVSLAKNIINAQSKEIEEMKKHL